MVEDRPKMEEIGMLCLIRELSAVFQHMNCILVDMVGDDRCQTMAVDEVGGQEVERRIGFI